MTPPSSLADQPVHVTVTHLRPHALVSLELRAKDARGVAWTSSARFRADRRGVVDVDRAAPVAGDYAGVWGMGPVMSLRPGRRLAAFAWDDARRLTFTLTVRSRGRDVATTSFRRRFAADALTRFRPARAAAGFVGEYVTPSGARRRPAILAFGGYEGGLAHVALAEHLAARGYPTLTIAYFGVRGLPRELADIPLEYFARALRWLAHRPEVDPRRIVVLGISRGSEAALLLGVHYPRLVHGVVASVPSNVVTGPSWTLHGRRIPFTLQFANPHPLDDPRAVIPVERIRGPVFASCAENDLIWPSCAYAEAIASRLAAHHHSAYAFYESPAAGHLAGTLVPYELSSAPGSRVDEQARERLWPRLLVFLGAYA